MKKKLASLIYVYIFVIVLNVSGRRVVDKVVCLEGIYRRRSISVRRLCVLASLGIVVSFCYACLYE